MMMIGDDGGKLSPKMVALPTDRMRRFVLALLAQGRRNYTKAYRAAGYTGTAGALRVGASRLAHDQRIQAALHEEGARRFTALLPMALHVVEAILADEKAKPADRLKVAFGVMDRAGLHTRTETNVPVTLENDAEMLARIKMLAERCGIPLESLLGGRLARQIEGECVDATPAALPTP